MKRWQIVLCAVATVATVAAFLCICWWAYEQLVAIALFFVLLAVIAMSF